MSKEKYPVAIHEAGHVAVALATTLADNVVEAEVYFCEESQCWQGRMVSKPPKKKLSRRQGAERFAISIGGPLVQIMVCPESISDDLRNLIMQVRSLLGAAIVNRNQHLKLDANWWPDLRVLIGYFDQQDAMQVPAALMHLFDTTGYFDIEKVVNEFLSSHSDVIQAIAQDLMEKDRLSTEDISSFGPMVSPLLDLPSSLPFAEQ